MRRLLLTVGGLLLAGSLLTAGARPRGTLASWVDAERGAGSFTAGTVLPPQNLTCTAHGGILGAYWHFSWSLPSGGAIRSGFHWWLSGSWSNSGDLSDPNATSLDLGVGVLGIGSGTFHLVAQGVAGSTWISTGVTANFSATTSLILSC